MQIISHEVSDNKIKSHILEMAEYIHPEVGSAFEKQFDEGQLFAIAPKDTTYERLLEFSTGGLTLPGNEMIQDKHRLVEKRTFEKDFAQILVGYLKRWPKSQVVGYDVNQEKISSPILNLSQAPFGVLSTKNPEISEIMEFIDKFSSAWTNVIMIIDEPSKIKSTSQLISSLKLFAIESYDGESFVYWIKSC